jgi:hypothetical protein
MKETGLYGMTRKQLLDLASSARIRGRHRMTKVGLCETVAAVTGAKDAGALPSCYGMTHLTLLEIDPCSAHAFWEMTPDDVRRAVERTQRGEGAWILRIYNIGSNSRFFDLPIDPAPRNWYIHLPFRDGAYFAEIGLRTASLFVPVCRSNATGAMTGESPFPPGGREDGPVESVHRIGAHAEGGPVLPSETGADGANRQSSRGGLPSRGPAGGYASGLPDPGDSEKT